MTAPEIIGQILGVIGAVFSVLSFQCRSNRNLFKMQIIMQIFFIASFVLLNAMTGAIMNVIGLARCVLMYINKPWSTGKYAMLAVNLLVVIGTVITYDKWYSILICVAMIVSTVFYFKNDGSKLRKAQLIIVSPCWLAYNILTWAIGAMIAELINMTSIFISFIRYKKIGFTK